MNQAADRQVVSFRPRGETGSRAPVMARLGGILGKVARALQVFGAAKRVAGALESRRMPSMEDLEALGIRDATSFRRYTGR